MTASTTRRDFLRSLAGAAAGLGALPTATATLEAAPLHGLRADERFWEAVRGRFPLRDGIVPMNAANLAPAPHSVVEMVLSTTRQLEGDVSSQNRARFSAIQQAARERMARFLGAAPEEIALVRNASEANNIIVGGLALRPGDEVVLWDENHQTNNVAWDVAAQRYGFTVRRVGFEVMPESPGEALELFVRAMGPTTRVVAFSDMSNVSGLLLPTRAICHAARERGIYSHVDGAQTLGAMPRALHDLGCDSYAASAHKWLMGPKETGVLFVRGDRIPEIWPGVVGVGWGNAAETSAVGARKFETLGQRNDATIAALIPAIDFAEEIGIEVIGARIAELASLLKDGIREIPGAQVVTPAAPELGGGVVVTRFPERDVRALVEALYRDHRISGAATGGLRLCPHVYTTRADVERAVEAVARLARAQQASIRG
jgi:selenocysteine lyase/cysteine desulfurase